MRSKAIVSLLLGALLLATASCLAATITPTVAAVNANGTNFAAVINSLNVESNWAKGQYVNWETGATITNGPISNWATDRATHCSGFAGAVSCIAGVPLLHAPFPNGAYSGTAYTSLFAAGYGKIFPNCATTSDSLLATKQGQWLANIAQAKLPVSSATSASPNNWVNVNAYTAQSYANQGYLCVVVYQSTTSGSSGHIAVIVPYQAGKVLGDYAGQSTAYTSLAVDGPFEAQSGGFNSSYTTVSRGFAPPDKASSQWFGYANPNNTVKFYLYYMAIDWSSVKVPTGVL